MPRFQYSGKLIDGKPTEGVVAARNEDDLQEKLLNQGVFVDEYSPAFSKLQQTIVRQFQRSEITKITRQLSILLKSEVPLLEALELVSDQIRAGTLREVFTSIIKQVQSGKTVATAFGTFPRVFDELYLSMIESGELSATLADSLEKVAEYREKHEATSKKIKSAIAYPALVILVAVMVVFCLVLYVVPVFSSMYASFGAELPELTQKVVLVSDWLKGSFWYLLSAALLVPPFLVVIGVSSKSRYILDKAIISLPFIRNLSRKIIAARFCRTMGSLLTSGVDIIYALQIASRTTGNSFVANAIEPAESLLAEGKSFTQAIANSNVFPPAVLRLTASGEKTGRLGEMLSRAADYYENESNTEITTLTTLIEPIIIIILGVFIAFILVAMYLPLFDLVGAM